MAFLGQYSPNTYRTNNQFSASAGQTVFNCTYDPAVVDVYHNGVKLVNGQDFDASSGTAIVLTDPAQVHDTVEVIAYKVNLAISEFTSAPILVNASTGLVQGQQYVLTTGNLTLTLPTAPQPNWKIRIIDASGSITNQVSGNGSNIMGAVSNLTLDIANSAVSLLYIDSTRGWWII